MKGDVLDLPHTLCRLQRGDGTIKRMKAPTILIPALGLVVALVVGVLVYAFAGPVRYYPVHFLTLLNAPQVVKDMVFVVERPGAAGLARVVRGGIKTDWFPGITFRSLDQRAGVLVAVIERASNGAVDVVQLRSGELIPLTNDGAWKGGVALSPDAAFYAYTVRTREPLLDHDGREMYDVGNYRTEVRSFDGTYLQSFAGNHPHFVTESILAFYTTRGIETYDLVSKNTTSLIDDITHFSSARPLFGSNGAFIVSNSITGDSFVFEYLSKEPPMFYQLIGILPASPESFSLTRETDVYRGVLEGGSFTVQKFNDFATEPLPIFSIPLSVMHPVSALLVE